MSDASGDQVSLLDTIQDPDAPDPAKVVDASELKDRVADAIARLPEREKLVIALYYYENLTLREIGEVLGVTESRISQLHTKAVLRPRARTCRGRQRAATDGTLVRRLAGRRLHEREESETMHKPADRIRNVALVGHRGSGKTSLHEALLFEAGAVNRLGSRGRRHDGLRRRRRTRRRARCRSRPRCRRSSGRTARSTCIDTPGEPSFVADALGALRVCESAVFVVNAVMGVEVSTDAAVAARRRSSTSRGWCS